MDSELAAKHRTLWGQGSYAAVGEVVQELGPALVDAAKVAPGLKVLDVACGTGNAALPAAAVDADVVATDLVPDLLDIGKKRAAAAGLSLTWQAADAEQLPFTDGEFDVVMSCIGVMFAPHHHAAADELVRVCRPGGTIALASWTPDGFVGRMFTTMRPYAPPPPHGASPPMLWGSEGHVVVLLNGAVDDVIAEHRTLRVDHFADGAAFRDFFKANYGPAIAVYRHIEADPEKVVALDTALAELGDRALAGEAAMDWEYLVVVARRAGR